MHISIKDTKSREQPGWRGFQRFSSPTRCAISSVSSIVSFLEMSRNRFSRSVTFWNILFPCISVLWVYMVTRDWIEPRHLHSAAYTPTGHTVREHARVRKRAREGEDDGALLCGHIGVWIGAEERPLKKRSTQACLDAKLLLLLRVHLHLHPIHPCVAHILRTRHANVNNDTCIHTNTRAPAYTHVHTSIHIISHTHVHNGAYLKF